MIDSSAPPKRFSQNDMELVLLQDRYNHLLGAYTEQGKEVSQLRTELKNLTVVTERLAEKVASLSDIILKIGIPAIIGAIGSALAHWILK